MDRLRYCGALLLCLLASQSVSETLVFLVPESSDAMPMARIEEGEVKAGIHLDLARAISAELGVDHEILVTSRARVDLHFSEHNVDIWCYSRPEWTREPLQFTQPILRNTEAVVWHKDAPPVSVLEQLSGEPIGTIGGFFYPVLNQLGDGFVRDDSPGLDTKILKLMRERVQYLYVDELLFDYYNRFYSTIVPVSEQRLQLNEFEVGCALHPDSPITLAQLDAALDRLKQQGNWQAILSRYGVEDRLPR